MKYKKSIYRILGSISAFAGAFIFLVLWPKAGEEIQRIKTFQQFQKTNPGAAPLYIFSKTKSRFSQEPLAIYEGVFSPKNTLLEIDFIIGCHYIQTPNDSSKKQKTKFNQTVLLQPRTKPRPGADSLFSVQIADLCPKGNFSSRSILLKEESETAAKGNKKDTAETAKEYKNDQENFLKKKHYQGFKAGDTITVLGYYSKKENLLKRSRHFGGTSSDYLESLKQTRSTIAFLSGLFLLSGIFIVVSTFFSVSSNNHESI